MYRVDIFFFLKIFILCNNILVNIDVIYLNSTHNNKYEYFQLKSYCVRV